MTTTPSTGTGTGTPLLTARDVVKRYGGVVAVDHVDLAVGAGEIVGLVGPNGAGKTTLVDCISGAQQADGGDLELAGRALTGPAARRGRQGLAWTFQYPHLALELTVRENIEVGAVAADLDSLWGQVRGFFVGGIAPRHGARAHLVDALARDLGLTDLDREAGDLTLGQQRLVEVARALARHPQVLLLDEPFAGSDATGARGISQAIRDVRDQGLAVILVDHNVDLVAALADRIVLLDRGAVVFDGDPEACLRSPQMQEVYFGSQGGSRAESA